MDLQTETRLDELTAGNRRMKKWLAVVTAWLVITWLWPLAPATRTVEETAPPPLPAEFEIARVPVKMRATILAARARLEAAKADTVLSDPAINEIYYFSEPLPKDSLFNRKDWHPETFAECHRLFLEQMQKFAKWEMLQIRSPFETYTPRGQMMVFGVVFKTKKQPSEKWMIWDQTWFFRGGQLVMDFNTSEFGKMGPMAWCFKQEDIQKLYGPRSTPAYQEESAADRKARFEKSLDEHDEQMREIFRRQKAMTKEGLEILGIEEPAGPGLPGAKKLDPEVEQTIQMLEEEIEKLRRGDYRRGQNPPTVDRPGNADE